MYLLDITKNTFNESQDIEHLVKLVSCLKVDWENLPKKRSLVYNLKLQNFKMVLYSDSKFDEWDDEEDIVMVQKKC